MPSDRGEPWGGSTYKGFSGPGASEPAPEPPPPPRPTRRLPEISRKNLIIGGVGAAVLAGLAFGLWARPSHDRLGSTAEAATAPSVPIVVNRPQPPPTPQATGRMEVLPGDMIQQARASAPAVRPAPAPRPEADTGLPQDASEISPQIEDPPEVRWTPPEQRLSRAERRALREQRWAEDAPPPPRFDPRDAPRPLYAPPPDEDDDSGQ